MRESGCGFALRPGTPETGPLLSNNLSAGNPDYLGVIRSILTMLQNVKMDVRPGNVARIWIVAWTDNSKHRQAKAFVHQMAAANYAADLEQRTAHVYNLTVVPGEINVATQ